MSTTIQLPSELVRELERRAADQGQELQQTVTELLRKGLDETRRESDFPPSTVMVDPKTGLPYIECRHAAKDMTPQRVADILLEQEATWHNEAR